MVNDDTTSMNNTNATTEATTPTVLTGSPSMSALIAATRPQLDPASSSRAITSAAAPDIDHAVRSSTVTRVPSCPTGRPAASPPTEGSSCITVPCVMTPP